MRRALALVVAAALAASLASCGGDDKNFLERMFDLESRASKNAPPSTVEELKKGIAEYGREVDETVAAMEKVAVYWRMLAVKYLEKGLYGDAYDAAMKALRHYPDSSGLYYVAGVSATFLAKTTVAEPGGGAASRDAWMKAAQGALARAVEVDPRNSRALYALGVFYTFELEDHEAALAPLEALLAFDTSNVDALFVYARALYGAGALSRSVDAYDRIIATSRVEEKRAQAADNKKRILDELYGR